MTGPGHRTEYTYGEYLSFEASSNVKHEFFDGQIYAMAGGTPDHASLSAAVIGMLFAPLRRVISDNYFCRLATITFAGGSAVRTACATVRS
jgi:Uma2 family endonuclease